MGLVSSSLPTENVSAPPLNILWHPKVTSRNGTLYPKPSVRRSHAGLHDVWHKSKKRHVCTARTRGTVAEMRGKRCRVSGSKTAQSFFFFCNRNSIWTHWKSWESICCSMSSWLGRSEDVGAAAAAAAGVVVSLQVLSGCEWEKRVSGNPSRGGCAARWPCGRWGTRSCGPHTAGRCRVHTWKSCSSAGPDTRDTWSGRTRVHVCSTWTDSANFFTNPI